jgi:hypothetical protein
MGANMYPNFLRVAVDWFKGDYASGQFYNVNDVVIYNGNAYVCINTTNNIPPTNSAYWRAFTSSGTGDMTKATYDPNGNGIVDQAERLSTPRSIGLTGVVSGSTAFDGSSNVTITTTGNLSGLSDVDASAKANGKMITWNATTGKHVYTTPPTGGTSSVGLAANIKNYGALGDGSDATTALQNCLNANGFAYVPIGDYTIGTITLQRGQRIYGESMLNTRFLPAASIPVGGTMFSLAGDYCTLENFYVFGSAKNFNCISDADPTRTTWFERLNVNNVAFYNVGGNCIHLTGRGLDYMFEKLWIDKCGGIGVYCRNISDSNMFNCSFAEGAKAHVDIDNTNFRFVNCKFMMTGTIAGSPAVSVSNCIGISFAACEFQQNLYDGLLFTNVRGATLTGCIFDSNNAVGLTGSYGQMRMINSQFVHVEAVLIDGRFNISSQAPYITEGINGFVVDDKSAYNNFQITYYPYELAFSNKANHVEPFVSPINDISSRFVLNNREYFDFPYAPVTVGNNLTLGTGGSNSQSANFTITPTSSNGGNIITLTQGTTKTLAASGEFYSNKATINLSSLVGTANDPTGKSYVYVMYDNKVIETSAGAFNAYIDITESSTTNPTAVSTGQVRIINVNKNSKYMPMAVYKPLLYSAQAGFSVQLNFKVGCSASVTLNANDIVAMFKNIRIGFF